MAAWEVTERVGNDDDPGRRRDVSRFSEGRVLDGPPANESAEDAHLDDLINEHSAATAEMLEEQERARAAALATAPIRVVSVSRAKLGAASAGLANGAGSVVSAFTKVGALVGTAVGSASGALRARAERRDLRTSSYDSSPTSRRAVRSRGRRVGFAALVAVAVAAPTAGSPAPWAALVGASVGSLGARNAPDGLPDDLFSPKALGPLPSTLPARGIAGGTAAGLDTTANPKAAGLPLGDSDRSIPSTVLLAYQKAADRMAAVEPGCQLPWTLLAGIGKVESNHARSWNGNEQLTANGTATPPILGPVLDGSLPGTAQLLDTDGGRLDGNAQFDRAVGPMQFVPGTWKLLGQDGNGDGVADPNNVWDASLAAGTFLCQGGRDLGNAASQAAAVFAYNPSSEYVRTVLAWSLAYATGAEVDLSLPTGGVALPPQITGGTPGFPVPMTGSPLFPYADPEPFAGSTGSGSSGSGSSGSGSSGSGTPNPNPGPAGGPSGGTGSPGNGTTAPKPGGPATAPPPTNSTPPPHTTPPPPPPKPAQKFALTLGSVTATRSPAKPTTANPATSVTVTVKVTANKAGYSRLVLTLTGKDGFRVTGRVQEVQFHAGENLVPIKVNGGFLGDSGVDGAYTASLTQQETDSAGNKTSATASALGTPQQVGSGWKAGEFVNYVPTLQRIRDRVAEFASRSQIDGPAERTLNADLSGSSPNLAVFRQHLATFETDKSVSAEAFTRLDSLADRRQHHPGRPLPPEPANAPSDPGWDPVYGRPSTG